MWVQVAAGSLIGRRAPPAVVRWIDHVLARNGRDHDFGTVEAGVERMGVPDHCHLELRGKSGGRHRVRDTAALGAPRLVVLVWVRRPGG